MGNDNEQFKLYKRESPFTNTGWAITNTEDPGRTFSGTSYNGTYDTGLKKLEHFRKNPGDWHSPAYRLFRNETLGERIDKPDPKALYEEAAENLRKVAEENGFQAPEIPAPVEKPKYPEEPKGYGTVIKFPGLQPCYRDSLSGKWVFTGSGQEYTWAELFDGKPGRYSLIQRNAKFEVLYKG